jgi:alkanesulfonate monooxygenase SsuD/methylene tetrahydromethanopterin reductase-like flavin-dependent oxidoreductase (luciferase family)
MALRFGVFDHIEPVPGLSLQEIYALRLVQIERLDAAGFYAYHLAEHHTPAVHSLAPSQNVFLAAVSQRTRHLRFGPCVYVLPLHHPVRLIEEISMLDNLSGGRMEIGVGRGGVLEAYFWGQDSDVEVNYARFLETLAIVRQGLSHDELTYHGQFYDFDQLPMRLRPQQTPYPPLWYMRNIETAAVHGMNAVLDVPLGVFDAYVKRYRELWEEHQGMGALTRQGMEPKIGLIAHMLLDETDEAAVAAATPAWAAYRWNLETPRRLEAEKRGLTQFLGERMRARPASAPAREVQRDLYASVQRSEEQERRRLNPGGLSSRVIAGSPNSLRTYLDEYVETGANYFICSFQWGDLTHEQAMRSIELFSTEVMPHYVRREAAAGVREG